MLDDRSYMRDPSYGSRRSVTLTLIIILAVCFVIQNLVIHYLRFPVSHWFGLTRLSILKGYLWQFLTFQFLHAPFGSGGFFHIFFNCWGIWVFGRAVEEAIGPKKFLQVYLLSGVAGGLLQCALMIFFPAQFGVIRLPGTEIERSTVGASAGLFGLIAAYAALFPSRQLTLLLFFVLPVTLTARLLLILSGLIAIFGILVPVGQVAHGAHLGGLLGGLAFIRWFVQSEWQMPRLKLFQPREKVFTRRRRPGQWPASNREETDLPSEEFISREVDPILDKISAHGIQSLTERERKILEAARARMAKR